MVVLELELGGLLLFRWSFWWSWVEVRRDVELKRDLRCIFQINGKWDWNFHVLRGGMRKIKWRRLVDWCKEFISGVLFQSIRYPLGMLWIFMNSRLFRVLWPISHRLKRSQPHVLQISLLYILIYVPVYDMWCKYIFLYIYINCDSP